MTGVAEARALMLAAVAPVGSEVVALAQAHRRTLAAPVVAVRAQPPFAASAMDGYALRAADTPGVLRLVGEAAAGHAYPHALRPGEAVRISTGAPLPIGADAILIQEEARFEGERLAAPVLPAGLHVRAAGIDLAAGAEAAPAGTRLDPVTLSLAAAAGAASVRVRRQPSVTVLCAGDEIAPPGKRPRSDQIFESCSYAVAGLAEQWGACVARCEPLADDSALIERAAANALAASDLVVFIGSASVGPHDHAKPAFERAGARPIVRKVDMRPGKPTWFAVTEKAPVLGLPGNPASAIVAAFLFLRPLIERMLGRAGEVEFISARLAAPLPANGAREAYLRAITHLGERGELSVRAFGEQDSSLLSVFASANALLRRPPGAPPADAGDIVSLVALDR